MAPFGIPNESDAFHSDMAEPDAVDIDILVAALKGDYVISGCAVTAQGSPDMTVAVAVGAVRINGAAIVVSAGNVTVGAAHASNPRFDLITVNDSGTKACTAGTAAANPVFPAIPANSVVLAAVYVPANDTDIDANQIVDKRVIGDGSAMGVDVQTFTASGTWTKPVNATLVYVKLISGGGGGGSGRRGAASSDRDGGSGGQGGGISEGWFAASALGATESVTVGAGGAGGAARTTNDQNGAAGIAGGFSGFGATPWLVAVGGRQGVGGLTTGVEGGKYTGLPVQQHGARGGRSAAVDSEALPGDDGGYHAFYDGSDWRFGNGGGGGGGGGPVDASDSSYDGGAGGFVGTFESAIPGDPGAAGGDPGTAASDNASTTPFPGAGGGGGGGNEAGAGGVGGVGGKWGGGGGGGGASVNGDNSGAGGAGGAGLVVVYSFMPSGVSQTEILVDLSTETLNDDGSEHSFTKTLVLPPGGWGVEFFVQPIIGAAEAEDAYVYFGITNNNANAIVFARNSNMTTNLLMLPPSGGTGGADPWDDVDTSILYARMRRKGSTEQSSDNVAFVTFNAYCPQATTFTINYKAGPIPTPPYTPVLYPGFAHIRAVKLGP